MPTIDKGDKILVTGANGYIAAWVTRLLLERGYAVRGTVRSEDKGEFMKNYFNGVGIGEKFETVIVDDISRDGVFDEAVKGVHAIAHTASPFHFRSKEPKEIIEPAVKGTIGILEATIKHGHDVKRIVITSSTAAIMGNQAEIFTEADWNNVSVKEVDGKGSEASPIHMYCASKALAEKAAWNFYEKHAGAIKWDITTLNPPYPAIHDVRAVESLNTSLALWYDYVVKGSIKSKEALADSNSWVDVRDIALAHAIALENKEAGGERIIINEGGYIWQEWLSIANSITPSPLPSRAFLLGFPEILEGNPVSKFRFQKSKEEQILGIKFYTKAETTKDILDDFARRGW
ncbi:Putative uncharacterized oxidoreductase [Psilocybe cubensis]|uniref:Uncharacterized oxidoreductase n=1 Tax=Psilocybe cubensis TaxID=181762 RepID=A0ACB8HE93_PSICU|nr:Putative uncharacterized oxidoreductase [Psilocybe cubensis]KAH9486118.1 Putative uncharacterized oxidoreductase [Psilocybe cubensis]